MRERAPKRRASASPLEALREALELSEKMLVSAREKRWVAFADLLKRREPHLNLLKSVSPRSDPEDIALREALLALNESISVEAALQRESSRKELRKIRQGRRAKTAYDSTMREQDSNV